jgi:hypothetical protein
MVGCNGRVTRRLVRLAGRCADGRRPLDPLGAGRAQPRWLAHHRPGTAEFVTLAPTSTLSLSSGWFTGMTHAACPTVSTDNQAPLADQFQPTLTVRERENAPRMPIASSKWRFGACDEPPPDDRTICYPAGFKPGHLYELIYRAKDPLVLGLGLAVARDLGTFLKSRDLDL